MDVSTPCAAWMVPVVHDERAKAVLQYGVEHHSIECQCGGRKLQVEMGIPLLSVVEGGLAFLKDIDGVTYAVLKRGLLPGEKFKVSAAKKRKLDAEDPMEAPLGTGPEFTPATRDECRGSRGAVGRVSMSLGRDSTVHQAPLALKTPKESMHLVK